MRDWRMTFLPQFKACVDAGSWSLMCSYVQQVSEYVAATRSNGHTALSFPGFFFSHSINGIPACANKMLLTDILRDEWGFKGYVVSDQAALGEPN